MKAKFTLIVCAVICIGAWGNALPNAHFYMSEDLIRLAAELKPIENNQFNTQRMSGGIVSGWVSTEGQALIDIVPDKERATYLIKVTGKTEAPQQKFRRGRFTVNSALSAPFTASKRIYFEGTKVKSDPAQVDVQSAVQIKSASAPRRLGARIAYKRATKSAPESEENSNSQIGKTIGDQLDSQVEESLGGENGNGVMGQLQSLGNGEFPPSKATLRSESTEHFALFHAAEPGRGAVTRETPLPIALKAGNDLATQTHESSANNYLERWLAGKEEKDLELFRLYKTLMSDEPYALRPHDRTERWSFLYAHELPVQFLFRQGRVEIRIHAMEMRRVAVGETQTRKFYHPFEVRAQFEPQVQSGRVILVRSAPVELNFTDGLVASENSEAWRQFFLTKFDAFFSEQWAFEGLDIPEGSTWERFTALEPWQVHSEGEWLTLGWHIKK